MSSSSPSWRGLDLPVLDEALCKGDPDPERWFEGSDGAPNPAKVAALRAVCAGCPVIAACRSYALRADLPGIWAGMTQAERRPLIRPRCGVCGTEFRRSGKAKTCSVACSKTREGAKHRRYEDKRRRTHCPDGHPYDVTNTDWSAGGHRICRACKGAA